MRIFIVTFFLLSGCAVWQVQDATSEPAVVQEAVHQIYYYFPEAPHSHVSIEYHHDWLNQATPQLSISEIEFYLPSVWLGPGNEKMEVLRRRGERLIKTLQHYEAQCLSVSISEHERRFVGIDEPLREIELDTACG